VANAIESILGQTFDNYEFIIVDNGSSDNSPFICDDYAGKSDKIRVVHRERGNIGSGRNVGLSAAKGKYITFIDDDDIAEPDMLAFLYDLIETHEADIALCGSYKNEDGVRLQNCVFDDVLVMNAAESVVELLNRKKYNVAMPTKLLKKSLFDNIKFRDTGKYDDVTVGYRLFAESKKVVGWGLPKYTFYRHNANNSGFTTNDLLLTPEQLEEYFEAFRERSEYLSNQIPELAEFARYTEWSYMISMCNKIISNKLIHCNEQLNHIKNTIVLNYDEFYNSAFLKDFEKSWIDKYIGEVV
jgi:glycosyltransferase involved in cell wall biosynthesis